MGEGRKSEKQQSEEQQMPGSCAIRVSACLLGFVALLIFALLISYASLAWPSTTSGAK
jgi:hypothetical protein